MSIQLGVRGTDVAGRDRIRNPRWMLWASAALHVAVLATPRTSAALAATRVSLTWLAPAAAGCATAEEIQDRVKRLTEHVLAVDAESPGFRITAEVSPYAESWRARIALSDSAGRTTGIREVQARQPDCHAVDVPAVLVIATLLDDLHQEETRDVLAADSGRPRSESQVALGAGATSAIGLGSRTWFGGTLTLQLPLFVPMPLEATVYLPSEEVDSHGRGVRAFGFHGGVGLCPGIAGSETFDFRVCAGAQVGGVWGTPIGLMRAEDGLVPMFLVGLEPKLLVAITHGLAMQLSVAGQWVAVRPWFDVTIDGERVQLQGDPFAVIARIGIISFLPW